MNLLGILTISPYYFCRKCVGATNENLNFDHKVLRVNTFNDFAQRPKA